MFKIDFASLEKKIEEKLPNELKILNFIDLGQNKEVVYENSEFNINNFCYSKNLIDNWDKDIIIDYFISNKNIENYWIGRTKGDLWEPNNRYLGLAFLSDPKSSLIVFSLNKKDFGSIWLEFPELTMIDGEEVERIHLDSSLINFLSKLERGIYSDRILNYLPLSEKLYKNWGEDFWRVKDKTQ